MRGFARAGALLCRPTACALAVRTVRAMSTQIPGYATKYTVLKSGEGAAVAKGKTVTVHATGVVQETGKTFWSTKDPDQEPFTYQAGVGQVITGWDQGILGMTLGTHLLHASAARPLSRPPAGAPYVGAPCMRRRGARADHPGARGLRCQGLPCLGHPARRHAPLHAGGAQHRVRPEARSWWRGHAHDGTTCVRPKARRRALPFTIAALGVHGEADFLSLLCRRKQHAVCAA